VSKSDYFENAVLNTLRNVSLAVASPRVALFTTLPGENGAGGVEVSGGGYARQAVTFGAASAGSMANSADVTFPQASAAWGNIVGFGIYDALSGGNLLYLDNLRVSATPGASTTTKQIDSGDQLKFPAGNLVIAED
jgi:hypothetical protein